VRIYIRLIIVALFLLAAFAGAAGFLIYSASRHEPQFYQQALRIEPELQREAGDELEQSMLELHNSARDEGRWEAVFTESQVNGWLAADLPEKFPQMLPAGTDQPRVSIDQDQIKIACRYQRGKVNTVISFNLSVNLTTEPNTLAVRVSKVRAGALPVPLKRFLAPITKAGANSDIALRWGQADGDPVALVTVPHKHADYSHREIYLESIEIRDGEVALAGRTQKAGDAQTVIALRSAVPLPLAMGQSGVESARVSKSARVTVQR
jgi:hypothetical protein